MEADILVPGKPTAKSPSNSLSSYEPANVRRALTDKLTPSEAVELVARLLVSFPNGGTNVDTGGYIGALAACLRDYPRCVAVKCVHPVQGLPRECRFKPTPHDVIVWCERELTSLRSIVDHDDRHRRSEEQRQRAAKDEKAQAAERETRETIDELRARYGPVWGLKQIDAIDAIRGIDRNEDGRKAARAAAEKARDERNIYSEYELIGMSPVHAGDILISPSLLKNLGRLPERPFQSPMAH